MDLEFVEDVKSLEWQLVDPAYKKLLRIHQLIQMLVLSGALIFLYWVLPPGTRVFLYSLFAIALLILGWLFFVWVPNTTKRLQYVLRDDDIQLRRGYLYWRHLAISCNRIQHLEVTQGPLERYLGLGCLVVYTAGTMGSDMKLPGLALETAQKIKAQLLKKINAEEIESDESL
ncbi:MAG: PH domain-containing protein [Cellvibrio sp.]|nr:PH domain-containing protein [Cellvibrio sp.]